MRPSSLGTRDAASPGDGTTGTVVPALSMVVVWPAAVVSTRTAVPGAASCDAQAEVAAVAASRAAASAGRARRAARRDEARGDTANGGDAWQAVVVRCGAE